MCTTFAGFIDGRWTNRHLAQYTCHMASSKTKEKDHATSAGEAITSIEVLTDQTAGLSNLSKVIHRSARKNAWVVYPSADDFSHFATLIGNLTGQLSNLNEPTFAFLRTTIKEGLPKRSFERVKEAIATTSVELSAITEISTRTVARRERFKPDESERILRVGSAFQKALELFKDLEKARRWFNTPKTALNGLSPIECCDTEAGAEEVEKLIGRIREGVYT